MHTPVLDSIVDQIAEDTQGDDFGFDPLTFISVIKSIIEAFSKCNLTAKIAERRVRNMGFLDRRRLRNWIDQHASDGEDKEAMFDAFMDLGPNMSEAKLKALFKECKPL